VRIWTQLAYFSDLHLQVSNARPGSLFGNYVVAERNCKLH